MSDNKNTNDYKFAKNVKVKVSKSGKYVSHILSDEKLVVSFPVTYYRIMFEMYFELDESGNIRLKKDKTEE